ncbi:hypothetical protein H2199_002967 [Coniosporium tulheliwenetii]|uniref:Uncharacterized protein n=1 Tax=Coniosporium tulheliwenetii TaxID=3383036 RepID=A0ACC2ZF48_9PEZI|nr:hypothetical protein H2199_002967 [Cladosporium sp. JES 115]
MALLEANSTLSFNVAGDSDKPIGLSTRAVSIAEAQSLCTKTDIPKLIEESRYAIADDDNDGSASETSDGGSDTDFDPTRLDVKDILEDLDTYTQCLADSSPSLACPAMDYADPEDVPANTIFRSRDVQQYYADIIRERFPEAAADIVDQLGRSNWERYKRVSDERAANLQASQLTVEVFDGVAASCFQDSGLGSSLPTQTNYAPTRHMEEISLAALPRGTDSEVNSEDGSLAYQYQRGLWDVQLEEEAECEKDGLMAREGSPTKDRRADYELERGRVERIVQGLNSKDEALTLGDMVREEERRCDESQKSLWADTAEKDEDEEGSLQLKYTGLLRLIDTDEEKADDTTAEPLSLQSEELHLDEDELGFARLRRKRLSVKSLVQQRIFGTLGR